jgi:hypothetical protein
MSCAACARGQPELVAGLQVLDETAFTLCKENRIPVLVFDLHAPGNILRAVQGRPSLGTVVDSEPDQPGDIAPYEHAAAASAALEPHAQLEGTEPLPECGRAGVAAPHVYGAETAHGDRHAHHGLPRSDGHPQVRPPQDDDARERQLAQLSSYAVSTEQSDPERQHVYL